MLFFFTAHAHVHMSVSFYSSHAEHTNVFIQCISNSIEPEHTSTAAIQPTNSTHLFSISEHTSTTAIQPTLNSSYVIQTSILHQYSTPVFMNLPTDLSNPAIYAIIGLSVGLMVLVIATATSLAIVCCIFQWRR